MVSKVRGRREIAERQTRIEAACSDFLDALQQHNLLQHIDLFTILDNVARTRNLRIACHQRGIGGTYIQLEEI